MRGAELVNLEGYVVAVIGAGSTVGREIPAVLRERAFPLAECRLYDDPAEDESLGGDDEGWEILPLADVSFEGTDVAFLCGSGEQAAEWAPLALAAGAVVVDLTQRLADSREAALIVPEVNAGAIPDGLEQGAFACPVPTAIALATVLDPIGAAAELRRVLVTSFEPVSLEGRQGVDELARQTRDLLVGESPDCCVFPRRIAFNVVPQVGDRVSGGRTRGEWQVESQTRRLLDLPDLPIAVTSAYVPIFYGQTCAVYVETERPLDAEAARLLLRQAPGILLAEERGADDYPTLDEVVGSEATHVGRLRDDVTVPHGLALWVAIDGLRKGGAVNAVQIAELALRERAQ